MILNYTQECALRQIESGMLSSPQIAFLVSNGLLIKPDKYERKNLKSATYEMRVSGIIITKDNKTQGYPMVTLCTTDDINRKLFTSIELEPNSLTYITTYEQFCLPKSIIARFNLKSKWVHKGLLLGTGPIVDPEFCGQLLIPIHNFSDAKVVLFNLDKIICVEFTKTLNTDQTFDNTEDVSLKYVKNESSNFDVDDYIIRSGGYLPGSSVLSKLTEIKQERDQANIEYQRQTRLYRYAGVGVLLALLSLVFTTWNLISSANKAVSDATMVIKKSDKIDYDIRNFATQNELNNLKSDLTEINVKINEFIEIGSANDSRAVLNYLTTSIVELEGRIKNIENFIIKNTENQHGSTAKD